MIQVNVWESKWAKYASRSGEGSPGHASIWVSGTYVSFWPGREVGTLKWNGHSTRTFTQDCTNYETHGQKRWSLEIPHASGTLVGLNEAAMLKRWHEITESGVDYTWDFQCSAVVNELLIAGGCQQFVPPFSAWSSWVIGAVSPSDVKDYTVTLVANIKKARGR